MSSAAVCRAVRAASPFAALQLARGILEPPAQLPQQIGSQRRGGFQVRLEGGLVLVPESERDNPVGGGQEHADLLLVALVQRPPRVGIG